MIFKMTKKSKLTTPAWITEGYDSPADYAKAKGEKPKEKKKGKTFKVKRCPECDSDKIEVVGGEKPEWKCNKCGYKGLDVKEEELTEEEFMKYLDEKGEEVA